MNILYAMDKCRVCILAIFLLRLRIILVHDTSVYLNINFVNEMSDSYTKEPATGLLAENVDPRSVTWVKDYGKLFQEHAESEGLSYGWIRHEHDMDIDTKE